MTPKKPVKRGRGRRPKPFIVPSSYHAEDYGIYILANTTMVRIKADDFCYAEGARKLAAWLLKAAEYLEQRGEK